MRKIGAVIVLNFRRLKAQKGTYIPLVALTILAIFLAGFFSAKLEIRPSIAVVTAEEKNLLTGGQFNVDLVKTSPPKSQLIRGKYQGIVHKDGQGNYTLETLEGEEFRLYVQKVLADPAFILPWQKKRTAGINILGYSLMFILLQGVLYLNLFTEDKETGTFIRATGSPLGLLGYIAGHLIFAFMMIYCSAFLAVLGLYLLKVDLGFSLGQYGLLLMLPALLSTAFAFFMLALIERNDDALSFSGSIIVLTSLLAGGFYELPQKEGFISRLFKVLPQRKFLDAASKLELQGAFWSIRLEVVYIIVISFFFFLGGLWIVDSRSKNGHY